jgi:hypothetical protein
VLFDRINLSASAHGSHDLCGSREGTGSTGRLNCRTARTLPRPLIERAGYRPQLRQTDDPLPVKPTSSLSGFIILVHKHPARYPTSTAGHPYRHHSPQLDFITNLHPLMSTSPSRPGRPGRAPEPARQNARHHGTHRRFTDRRIIEIIVPSAQFLLTNFINNVAETDIDFPSVNAVQRPA